MLRFCLFLLVVLTVSDLLSGPLSRCFAPCFTEEEVVKRVIDCIGSPDLSPYLEGDWERCALHSAQGRSESQEHYQVTFCASFYSETNARQAMFTLAKDKISNKNYLSLVYLTNDSPPSLQLFRDILQSPNFAMIYPEAHESYYRKGALVYIHSQRVKEGVAEGNREQVWTFITPKETYEAQITLIDDGVGGTYFAMPLLTPRKTDVTP